MATPQMRWLVAWTVCALAVTATHAQNTAEPEEVLKKRIMEEEILLKFLGQLRRISQRLLAAPTPGGAAKRIGSEFLGKRTSAPPASLGPPLAPLDMNDVTAAAILANQLLSFSSEKRLGSEFLGKRKSEVQGGKRNLGSEFLGKKSVGMASGMDAAGGSDVERWTQRLTTQK